MGFRNFVGSNWVGIIAAVILASHSSAAERVPFGCYPARLTAQARGDEFILQLTGTVPGVSYQIMMRSNAPYSQWLPFTYTIPLMTNGLVQLRISLKTGQPGEGFPQTTLHQVPASMLPRMQFIAGS